MEKLGKMSQGYDEFVHGLLRFSQALEQKKFGQSQLPAKWSDDESATASSLGFSLNLSHASPLSPLRSRDVEALIDIFTHDQLTEIEADIHQYLLRLYPEPCWEVEPCDLLKGFI